MSFRTSVASERRPHSYRAAVIFTAAALIGSVAIGGYSAAPASAAVSASFSGIVLGIGASENQRMVTWYSSADTSQSVQLAPTSTLVDGEFPAGATTFAAMGTANILTSGGFNRNATITGLSEDTAYTYRVGAEGNWSPAYAFATQSFDGDFNFLFLGDPQIGSSGNIPMDGAGWADTLDVAMAANPNTEILVSGGDQVDSANVEAQWDSFLAPDQLRQVPFAATIGNHDVGGKAYEQHLSTPNTDRSGAYYSNGNPASNSSGGNYWYIYKDVLFVDLNSNSYSTGQGGGGDEAHIEYVTDIIKKHGAEAKHTVLVYHHSIYSPAAHAKDDDNKVRREDFPTTFSTLGVDLVLQGHDHSYSRSYEIKNGAKANPDEQPGANDVFPGPGGVIYVTANSASGSKYYDISAPDNSETSGAGNGADPLNPESYWYNSAQNQEHVRSYVNVKVQADQLTVETVRSGTCNTLNAAVELGKVPWCGPDSGASAEQPVGSIVDSVNIHTNHGEGQDIQVTVPTAAPGTFGWTMDGRNSLVNLGTAIEQNAEYFSASGEITPIIVTDTRHTQSPWSISASVGDFQDGTNTFSGLHLGWIPKVVTPGAGTVAGAAIQSGYDGGEGLSVSRSLGGAAQGHDRGTATLGADLDLKIPSSVDSGSYRTTLTLTALSS
jgi:hypothetical protein